MRNAIDEANLTDALTEILKEMQDLSEQHRVGGPKRRNVSEQLGFLIKVTQEKKPAVEPKKEQSTELGKAKVEPARCERARRGREGARK